METLFLKPAAFSANPGASQQYILDQAKATLIGALSKTTKALADAMTEKMPSEAYMDTLIAYPSNKDLKHQMNHHPDTTSLITQAGRGGTQTTPYGNPFLTPTRNERLVNKFGQNPNTSQLGGKQKQLRVSPAEKYKRAPRVIVVRQNRIRRRYPVGAAYELKYRKKLRFSRGGKYAF